MELISFVAAIYDSACAELLSSHFGDRLRVDFNPPRVTLDGIQYSVDLEEATVFEDLLKTSGNTSFNQICERHPGILGSERLHRLKQKMVKRNQEVLASILVSDKGHSLELVLPK